MTNEEFLGMNIPELDELMGMMPAGMDTQGGEKRFCETTGKICYSRREAGNILNYTKRNKFGRNIPKRSFFCEECGTWHLTHMTWFGTKKGKKRISRIR